MCCQSKQNAHIKDKIYLNVKTGMMFLSGWHWMWHFKTQSSKHCSVIWKWTGTHLLSYCFWSSLLSYFFLNVWHSHCHSVTYLNRPSCLPYWRREEKRRVPYPENGLNVSVWDPEASPGLQSSACIICPFISIPFQLFKKAGANVANIVFSWLNWTKKRPNMLELFFSPSSRIPAPLDSSFQRNPELSCPLIVASAWLKTVTVPSSLVHIFLFFFPFWSKSQCCQSAHILQELLRGVSEMCIFWEQRSQLKMYHRNTCN